MVVLRMTLTGHVSTACPLASYCVEKMVEVETETPLFKGANGGVDCTLDVIKATLTLFEGIATTVGVCELDGILQHGNKTFFRTGLKGSCHSEVVKSEEWKEGRRTWSRLVTKGSLAVAPPSHWKAQGSNILQLQTVEKRGSAARSWCMGAQVLSIISINSRILIDSIFHIALKRDQSGLRVRCSDC
jgi:hypothetical protein